MSNRADIPVAAAQPVEQHQKAVIEKLKLELQSNKATANQEVTLATSLTNATPQRIEHLDDHFWAGKYKSWAPAFAPWTWGTPEQIGSLPEGVKWGVAYADSTKPIARKWVVAFDTQNQKAYAEAGPTGPIDWNVVEVKLGMCGSKTTVEDPILGGKATAEINGFTASGYFFE